MRISKRWRRIQPIYKYFGGDDPGLDYSEEAALEMFIFESTGRGDLRQGLFSREKHNGYAVGKHWMDVTIKMWREDLARGLLSRKELYSWFPDWSWWLDRVL